MVKQWSPTTNFIKPMPCDYGLTHKKGSSDELPFLCLLSQMIVLKRLVFHKCLNGFI